MQDRQSNVFHEAAYDDWLAAYYDAWYAPDGGIFRLLVNRIESRPEFADRSRSALAVLDVACGTGQTFIELSQAGFRPWASDGSRAMLKRAAQNCVQRSVSIERLRSQPLPWNDAEGCRELLQRSGPFDIVFALNNSLCHMPNVPGHLDTSFHNFFALLKPGGWLIVDTKKYEEVCRDGLCHHHELRFKDGKWERRTDRRDLREFDGKKVSVHTNLLHDVDPAFQTSRAVLIVTISRSTSERETRVLPYYPLPAMKLRDCVEQAGFVPTLHHARTAPLHWAYDCIVAERPS